MSLPILRGPTLARDRAVGLVLVVSFAAACSPSADPPRADSGSGTTFPADSSEIRATGTSTPGTSTSNTPTSTAAQRQTPAPVSVDRCGPVATSAGSRTVAVWHWLSLDAKAALTELVARYEATHPDIEVELVAIEGGNALTERLRLTPASEMPDVILGTNMTVRLNADSGRFVPISACVNPGSDPLATLLPVIESTYSVADTRWAAPFNVSTPVLVYDKGRWRAAGLDPDRPPRDLVEWEATIRHLKDSGATTTGIVLYDRSASWLITGTAAREDELLAEPQNGHDAVQVDEVRLAQPGVVATLERFRELKADGYVHWMGWDTGPNGADDLVQLIHPIEPTGMTLHTSAALGAFVNLLDQGGPLGAIEIGVAPFPAPGAGSLVGGGAWWLVDSGDPGRVRKAWELVEWLVSPEQIAEFVAKTGYAPTTTAAALMPVVRQRWDEYPFLQVSYDQLAASTGAPVDAGLQLGPANDVDREVELAAAFTIDAGNDPATELDARSEAIEELLNAYSSALDG